MSLIEKIKPAFWDESKTTDDSQIKLFDYAGIWKYALIGTSTIALLPLIIMFIYSHYEYKKALKLEMVSPISCFVSNTRRSLTSFLSERKAALAFIAEDNHLSDFEEHRRFAEILANLKSAFGEFVDLSLIDSNGIQRAYAGPGHLPIKDFRDARWYKKVNEKGVYVGDITKGFNGSPEFVIAIKKEMDDGRSFILRASIKAETLQDLIRSLAVMPAFDNFIINEEGVLQTASRFYGNIFDKSNLLPSRSSAKLEVREYEDQSGRSLVLGTALIEGTPFRFVTVAPRDDLMRGLNTTEHRFVVLLIASMVCVLVVIVGIVTNLVNRIYEADKRRVAVLHDIQYTNKMATIGRLSAGVAHEINNPLAIINEKSGLLKDLISMDKGLSKEKAVGIVDSILSSIERCSAITHSLLGFARHLKVRFETIHLENVIREVLVFVGKESEYRSITVEVIAREGLIPIESDVGQLEQVFLNIINNAFAAVDDGGRIDIELFSEDPEWVSVSITDNGHGISEENLKHIFDPFFSTKGEKGSGLGLSITYGIVQKLGGKLDVKSKKGKGSTFTVTLPEKRPGDI